MGETDSFEIDSTKRLASAGWCWNSDGSSVTYSPVRGPYDDCY